MTKLTNIFFNYDGENLDEGNINGVINLIGYFDNLSIIIFSLKNNYIDNSIFEQMINNLVVSCKIIFDIQKFIKFLKLNSERNKIIKEENNIIRAVEPFDLNIKRKTNTIGK